MATPRSMRVAISARRYLRLSAAPLSGAGGLRARLRTMPPDQRKASILRTCRAADGDKELAKRRRAGRAAAAASAQWERTPTPLPPWAHGGYFAPARRYRARAALARTQRPGFRSTFVGDRRSVEGECCMVASVEYQYS